MNIRTQIRLLQLQRTAYKSQYFTIPADDLIEHKAWLLTEIERLDNGIESLFNTLEDMSDFDAMISEGIKHGWN